MPLDISKRLAVHSIFEIFVENQNPEKILFHKVLQRVSVLLQDRLAYILYKKSASEFELFYSFLNDPLVTPKLGEFLYKNFGDDQSLVSGKLQKHLFQILDTEYHLLCVRILPVKNRRKNHKRFGLVEIIDNKKVDKIRKAIIVNLKKKRGTDKFKLSTNDHNALVSYVLAKVFNNKEEKAKNTGFDDISHNFPKYKEAILFSINNLEGRCRKYPNGEKGYFYQDTKLYDRETYNSKKDLVNEKKFLAALSGDELQSGALNNSFKKIRHSIFYNNESINSTTTRLKTLTNFMFFISRGSYDGEDKRMGEYDYGLKMAIPYDQKNELLEYFSTLDSDSEIFNTNYYKYSEVFSGENKSYKNSNWIKLLDDEFWDIVETDHTKIIEILGSDFGNKIRSIVDPIFYNHFVHFSCPFEFGGLDRIQLDAVSKEPSITKLKKLGIYDDCMRIIITYYLIFGMLSEEHKKLFSKSYLAENKINTPTQKVRYEDIVLVMVPLTLQGVCYGCVAHYAFLGDEYRLYNDNWQRNYNVYHNIDSRFRRSFRQQIEDLYLNELTVKLIENITEVYIQNKYQLSDKKRNQLFNRDLNKFASFIPFPIVSLEYHVYGGANSESEPALPENYVHMFQDENFFHYGLTIGFNKNPHFLQFFESLLLDKSKILDTVRAAHKSAIVGMASIKVYNNRLSANK